MKNKILICVLLAGLAGLAAGCVETVDGRTKAGVPVIKDSVEGNYEVSLAAVFDAAKSVLGTEGTLVAENTINHSLEAKVDQNSVWVRVDAVDTNKPLTHVVVQARTKGGGANRDLAHDLEKKVAVKLAR